MKQPPQDSIPFQNRRLARTGEARIETRSMPAQLCARRCRLARTGEARIETRINRALNRHGLVASPARARRGLKPILIGFAVIFGEVASPARARRGLKQWHHRGQRKPGRCRLARTGEARIETPGPPSLGGFRVVASPARARRGLKQPGRADRGQRRAGRLARTGEARIETNLAIRR